MTKTKLVKKHKKNERKVKENIDKRKKYNRNNYQHNYDTRRVKAKAAAAQK